MCSKCRAVNQQSALHSWSRMSKSFIKALFLDVFAFTTKTTNFECPLISRAVLSKLMESL